MSPWSDDREVLRPQENSRSGGLRHEVTVPARIEGRAGGFMDAEIVDVGSGGMHLRHAMFAADGGVDALPVGTAVTVTFAPDYASAPDDTVQLRAQVVGGNVTDNHLRCVALLTDFRGQLLFRREHQLVVWLLEAVPLPQMAYWQIVHALRGLF